MTKEQLESLEYNPDAVQIILEIIAEGQQAGTEARHLQKFVGAGVQHAADAAEASQQFLGKGLGVLAREAVAEQKLQYLVVRHRSGVQFHSLP